MWDSFLWYIFTRKWYPSSMLREEVLKGSLEDSMEIQWKRWKDVKEGFSSRMLTHFGVLRLKGILAYE